MECRGCGRELGDADVRMVAEWPFCLDCFENLLAKKQKPTTAAEEPAREPVTDEIPTEEAAPAKAPCHLCQREMETGMLRKVGIWKFCPECYADLTMPRVVVSPVGQEAEPGAGAVDAGSEKKTDEDREDKEDGEDREDPGIVARLRIGFTKFVECAGCGRRIPQGGSSAIEGKPFCPDCYYAAARQSTGPQAEAAEPEGGVLASVAAPVELESPAEIEPDGLRCQSCDQPGLPDSFLEAEGFRICKACLGTDRELAVRIARSRHQKLLQRLKADLLES